MNSIRCRQCEHYIEANAGEGKIYGCDRSRCVFEPTTKNDCEHCSKTYGTLGCCDFVSNEPVYSCKEGHEEYARGIRKLGTTTKNDLGVDCISREQALNEFCIYNPYDSIGVDKVRSYIDSIPDLSVFEQEDFGTPDMIRLIEDTPTVEAIPKDQYEQRLKEDAEILKDISNRLEEVISLALRVKHKTGNIDKLIDKLDVLIPIYENYRNKVENYDAVD